MWALDNRTPFAADRSWVRDRDGAEVWLVAVKGTFNINPDGSTRVADEQAEVQLAAKYSGEPGKSGLRYDSDLPRTKVTTDVIVNGHAYAPGGEPTKSVTVRFRVGELVKSLRVTGERVWKGFGFLAWRSRCRPFVKMLITYERAFGGMDLKSKNPKSHKWDPRNPIGTGFATRRSHLIGQLEPNIHAVGLTPFHWFRKPQPAGFGVTAGHWMPRVKLAGTCGAKWEAERAPLLPEDFDDRFYQCAPPDQRTARFLIGGEEVHLRNLTPGGSLAFRLPRIVLGFETDFGGEPVRHRANLHTVILEPDVPRVMLVWHTALQCHPKVTKLRSTRIIQKTLLNRPGSETQEFPAESEDVFA
jgi:hypothetical protein